MPVAHFVIKRYDREVDRKQVAIFPSTTFKGLGVQWARQAPVKYSAGFTFFSEHGEELPEEGAPEAGQTYIVLAADRDEAQRKVCEDASQVFHKIVRAGRKEEKSGVHGWQLLYAPEEFGEDGRFQKAKEANAYWVLNRTSFGDLERKVQSLLFDAAPPKKNVLLCGPAGTGKSHAVLAVVNSLIRRAQNRAEETRQQAGESSTFVHREGDIAFRVVPILDCGELLRNFTLTVAKGLATGFGDDLLALDEICQLKTADDVFTFINRQSLRVLFVLDQYQYVVEKGNSELRNSMDKLLYNQRSLRVTSAGSDEVKALMKTSHRYIDWFQLSSRLTEDDMLGWNLVYGTEAALTEARYADRLAIVDRNPLLLHAWYSTCKEAGVPVRTIEQRSEEEVLELLEQTSQALAESPCPSAPKRARYEEGAVGDREDSEAQQPGINESTGKGKEKETALEEEAMAGGSEGTPSFEELFARFLQHPYVKLIYSDLQDSFGNARNNGEDSARRWKQTHFELLLSTEDFVEVDFSLINGRHFELKEGQQARPANTLVRIVLTQFLEDVGGSEMDLESKDMLIALRQELKKGKHPAVVCIFAEKAVNSLLCRGVGKKFLPFPTSRGRPNLVQSFSTGTEQNLVDSVYAQACEALNRGESEFTGVFTPKSVAYRWIDAIQLHVRRRAPAHEAATAAGTSAAAVNQSRRGKGAKNKKKGKPKSVKPVGTTDEMGNEGNGIEVHITFLQVSLMKFEQHVFSSDGAMHENYCMKWRPSELDDSAPVHFRMVYILPRRRLPEGGEIERVVFGKETLLRKRVLQTLVRHELLCMSFEQFSTELAMVDKWPQIWDLIFK